MISPRIARLLRQLALVVEDMTDVEFENLLKFLEQSAKSGPRNDQPIKAPIYPGRTSLINLDDIFKKLEFSKTREEGLNIIRSLGLTRRELSGVASKANVHIVKQDNISVIEEKLVESIIGSRLNSLAIRGER